VLLHNNAAGFYLSAWQVYATAGVIFEALDLPREYLDLEAIIAMW